MNKLIKIMVETFDLPFLIIKQNKNREISQTKTNLNEQITGMHALSKASIIFLQNCIRVLYLCLLFTCRHHR